MLAPTLFALAADDVSTCEAGDIFSILVKAHLECWGVIKASGKINAGMQMLRRTRRIEKTTEQLRILKNSWRKRMKDNLPSFLNLVRAHNLAKREGERMLNSISFRNNEKAFRSNPWHYAKSICKDRSSSEPLQCDRDEALNYFMSLFEDKGGYLNFPPWIKEVLSMPLQ